MVAGLLGAIAWNLVTWFFGLLSSSSHALIGGLVGAAVVSDSLVHWTVVVDAGATKRFSAVRWGVARSIVVAWILNLPAAGCAARRLLLLTHRDLAPAVSELRQADDHIDTATTVGGCSKQRSRTLRWKPALHAFAITFHERTPRTENSCEACMRETGILCPRTLTECT